MFGKVVSWKKDFKWKVTVEGEEMTYLGWWMEAITAVGDDESWAIACNTLATRAAETESKPVTEKRHLCVWERMGRKRLPDVGSSRIKISGLAMSSSPILTLLISPPLIPRARPFVLSPILTFFKPSIPSFWRIASTLACFSGSGMFSGRRNRAAKRRASWTVNVEGRTSCWGTKPMRGLDWETDGKETWPRTDPDLCFPARISTRVVFPAPT